MKSRVNKRFMWSLGGSIVLIMAFLGCQTAKPMAVTPTASAIQVAEAGFSPLSPAGQGGIDISLSFGNPDEVKAWKVDVSTKGNTFKTWKGDGSFLPSSVTWDGTGNLGGMSADGVYSAKLTVDYKQYYQSFTAESRTFILDTVAPVGNITMDPAGFTATEKGVTGPLALTMNASSPSARMDSWSLDVIAGTGELTASWSGLWPDVSVVWDGSTLGGAGVDSSMTYQAVATVRDEFGNSSEIKTDIAVAGMPQKPFPVAAKPGHPGIVGLGAGFSPNGDKVADTFKVVLGFGQDSAVASWKVTISSPSWNEQKTYTGGGSRLPSLLSWDGTSDAGIKAPEGTYKASLAVDYGTAFAAATATTGSFVLDLTPPSGSIALSSPLFSPIEVADTISLKLSASSKVAKIDSWILDIYDPEGNFFKSFAGKWPLQTVVWDGRNARGVMVQSAEDYTVVARVRDQFGIVGKVKSTIPVDILVEKNGNGYRILASRIFFKAFTADYKDVSPFLAKQNAARLDALAVKLEKFGTYKIRIVGHAVMEYWDMPAAGAAEQREVLIPLSKARAEAMKAALASRGVVASRSTTEGVGASDQLVPDSDYRDRWQNRRVSFFLD